MHRNRHRPRPKAARMPGPTLRVKQITLDSLISKPYARPTTPVCRTRDRNDGDGGGDDDDDVLVIERGPDAGEDAFVLGKVPPPFPLSVTDRNAFTRPNTLRKVTEFQWKVSNSNSLPGTGAPRGRSRSPHVSLALAGPHPVPSQLYDLLLTIPSGRVSTYGQLATLLGSSARAGQSRSPPWRAPGPSPADASADGTDTCSPSVNQSRFCAPREPVCAIRAVSPRHCLDPLHRRLRRRVVTRRSPPRFLVVVVVAAAAVAVLAGINR